MLKEFVRASGGTVYAWVSKTHESNLVWVQIPPRPLFGKNHILILGEENFLIIEL